MNKASSISFRINRTTENSNEPADWVKRFNTAICNLDILSIETLLNDDIIINDQTKWEFLTTVRDRLAYIRKKGNKHIYVQRETCKVCKYGCPVFLFKGKPDTWWIAFRIEHENGALKDITICNLPTGI